MLDLNDFGSVQTTKLGAEALFTKPLLYKAKINLLLRLNKTDDISVDNILLGKAVLDIGCGPFTYGYDTKLPASITGIEKHHRRQRLGCIAGALDNWRAGNASAHSSPCRQLRCPHLDMTAQRSAALRTPPCI